MKRLVWLILVLPFIFSVIALSIEKPKLHTFSGWRQIDDSGHLGCFWSDGKIYSAYPGREGFVKNGVDYTVKSGQIIVCDHATEKELKSYSEDAHQRLYDAIAFMKAFDIYPEE